MLEDAVTLLERGIGFVIFEAGDQAAASVRAWGHTRLFSPRKHLVDPASRRLLETHGWELPDRERVPTGTELVEKYVAPLAGLEPIASRLRTGVEVLGVTREGMDRTRTRARFATPFALRIRTASGEIEDVSAGAVIDASGTYRTPNSLDSGGLQLLGMTEIADRVTAALPDVLGRDRALFADQHTTVVGAGHSARRSLTDASPSSTVSRSSEAAAPATRCSSSATDTARSSLTPPTSS
jgi:hypothetical protein